MQKVIRKLHHTTTIDKHKSTTILGENHVSTCSRNLQLVKVLNADVIQKPKTRISDADRYQKTASREEWSFKGGPELSQGNTQCNCCLREQVTSAKGGGVQK